MEIILIIIVILFFIQIGLVVIFFMTYGFGNKTFSSNIDKLFKKQRFYDLEQIEKDEWYSITESKYRSNNNDNFNTQKISYINQKGHNLIVGGSGTGKTQKIIIPSILLNANSIEHPSFIINDIKGEIYEKTFSYLKDKDYKIINLNLNVNTFLNKNETINSDFYNPLQIIFDKRDNPLELKDYIDLVAKFVFNEEKEKDPFWLKKAQELFIGIIYLMILLKIPEEDFTFKKVVELFLDLPKYKDIIFNKENDQKSYFFLKEFFDESSKTIDSIFLSFKVEIMKYIEGVIEIISSKSSFKIEDLVENKIALFINNKGNNGFVQNYISMVVFQINTILFNKNELTLKRPIINVLDEFSNFSKLENFDNWLSLTRQKNIWYFIAIQSISQFENIYGNINIYASNFKYDYFLGGGDNDGYEYFVKGYREKSKKKYEEKEKVHDKISYTRFNTLNHNEYILRVKGYKPTIKHLDYIDKISNLFYKEIPQPIQNIYNISNENFNGISYIIYEKIIRKVLPEKIDSKNGLSNEEVEKILWSLNKEEFKLIDDEIKQNKYKKI